MLLRDDNSREQVSAFDGVGWILPTMSDKKPAPPPPPNRLREWRKARQLVMADVAEQLGVKTATVARHETLGAHVTLGQLYDYARIYRVRVEDLLTSGATPANGMGDWIDLGQRLSPMQRKAIDETWKAFAEPQSPFVAERGSRRSRRK